MLKQISIHVFQRLPQRIVGVFFGICFLFPVFGQFDNTVNPFVDEDSSAGAGGVALVGLEDAEQDTGGQKDAVVNVIKGAINRVLGMLALVALIIVMYGGFRMVTAAGNEDQYNSGFTILKQAAVGLVVIGLAWFIVSLVFWLLNLVARGAEDNPAGTDESSNSGGGGSGGGTIGAATGGLSGPTPDPSQSQN